MLFVHSKEEVMPMQRPLSPITERARTPAQRTEGLKRLKNLVCLVPRQLTETLMVIMQERWFRESPPEAATLATVTEEETKDLESSNPGLGELAKSVSGMHIPAPTKQECLQIDPEVIEHVRTQLVSAWLTIINEYCGENDASITSELTEELFPSLVPDIDVYMNGEARKAKDAREALDELTGMDLEREETITLYLAFVSNVRAYVKRRGEILLPRNIVIGRDEHGYYARRQTP